MDYTIVPKLVQFIQAKDGSLSTPKLAALLAHLAMFTAFCKSQVLGGLEYNEALWVCYGGFAILHSMGDKATTAFSVYKTKALGVPDTSDSDSSLTTTKSTVESTTVTKTPTVTPAATPSVQSAGSTQIDVPLP